ncbi:MAG TPA: NADH-quinone oxidoreductase subunit L [Coriobacteriia bacterium]|jgi:NADH-quinone oxidoreductase subunit L
MTALAFAPWLAVATPFAVTVLAAVLGRFLGRGVAWLAMLAPLSLLAVGVSLLTSPRTGHAVTVPWLLQGTTRVTVGVLGDGLAALMLVVVGVVALMVMLFSVGYMAGDDGYTRYFALLALFTTAMSGLVLSADLVVLLGAWELVGACSYLLIGFWYRRPSAAAAALKAFLVTHVGDAGMLLGIALLWSRTRDVSLDGLRSAAASLPPGVTTAIALLLLLGAIGKSAQFPLHFWLPDAMEGPTPVSALIHAATMVAAGVFLVARLQPLFQASPTASGVVLAVGAFTALMAATIAVAQSDIKKVLAYSTISQLGFMFAALGAGAWQAAMFHLVTHAAFKALLFLGAGSVIHGTGTQELSEMGGLARKMPVTAVTWLVGALALAGIPPLAGFWSKDAVIASVLRGSPLAGVALLLASMLTAFYITRATRLAFFGAYRGGGHPHEGGWVMAVPLGVLALGAVFLGAAGKPIEHLLLGTPEPIETGVAAIAVVLALVGAGLAWRRYASGPVGDELAGGRVWDALKSGYAFDAAVMRAVVAPVLALAGVSYERADRDAIDAAAEGVGRGARGLGALLARLQSGDAQWYGALIGAGVVLLAAAALWAGR